MEMSITPFFFENYRIIKGLIEQGHEIGYHSEAIDQALIWDEDPSDCLIRDLNLINVGFGIEVKGVAVMEVLQVLII